MKRFFDQELESLRSDLILLGEKAIRQVIDVTEALVQNDAELAARVIARDDEIDELDKRIDSEAIRFIGLRSAVASELRLLIIGMKASNDLERVGDECTSIAKRVKRLSSEPPLKPYVDLPRMSDLAVGMLRDAIEAFLHRDDALAVQICHRDREVDDINRQLHRELAGFMIEDRATINRALELMFISKSFERIADHATNLAEEVIFLIRGEDVRHTPEVKKPKS
ncbi:MAG: phosphate transport system regulatory protein PhoU [Puniceicoccaceae bacterium]|nr:MAG: phosphate transport system regulatory protein PhoU [Puniceicoccaceae bacterium]